MLVSDLCTRKTIVIREEKSAYDAAKLMKQYNVGCLVVVKSQDDHNIPVGMITDRDIVIKAMLKERDPHTITVREIMSTPALTVAESTSIIDALMKMRYNSIRRVPVVNPKGQLVGILSLDDILDSISKELNEITQIFRKEEPVI
jgi:CBS domain-containing protein